MVARIFVAAACVALFPALLQAADLPSGTNLGAVTGGEVHAGQRLIEDKCAGCHSKERIEAAKKQQKNLAAIVKLMEKQGVVITDRDREVLQHFWTAKAFK